MKLYSYCLRYDDGAAPNPFWGVCTLTICKPAARAQCGYEWECRRPHNFENPPGYCPRCHSRKVIHVKAEEKQIEAWRKSDGFDQEIRII